MTLTPWTWQQEDVDTLRENGWVGALIIEAGGGKTLTACVAIKESDDDVVLIIAPDSTHQTAWAPTVEEITGREAKTIGNKNLSQRSALVEFELGIRGIYMVTPQLFGRKSTDTSIWRGDMLIVDEIHQLATPGCNGQRKLSGYDMKDDPMNVNFSHRLALSGTPMRQNFYNMWSLVRFLWPELDSRNEVAYSNPYVWAKDRMTSEVVYTSRKNKDDEPITATNFLAETEPGKLVNEMPCAIIHKRREECCKYHPNGFLTTKEPQELERFVELTAKQKKAIHELEEHYMTYIEDNSFVVELSMVQKQRIRQICLGEPVVEFYWGEDKEGKPVQKTRLHFEDECVSPFLNDTLDIMKHVGPNEPVVVFLDSQRFADVAVKRLNKAGVTTQEYSGKKKADLKRFGFDYQVLVGVTSAIGTGTDGLQKNCNTEIWLETPVSITNETQGKARLDRMMGKQVQSYTVKDTLGYSQGRISDNLQKRMMVNQSLRKAVV